MQSIKEKTAEIIQKEDKIIQTIENENMKSELTWYSNKDGFGYILKQTFKK